MRIEETLAMLREAHEEPIAEAHYAAVRARVLAQLEMKRRPWWRGVWAYGFAGIAVAAGLVAGFWPTHVSVIVGQALPPANRALTR